MLPHWENIFIKPKITMVTVGSRSCSKPCSWFCCPVRECAMWDTVPTHTVPKCKPGTWKVSYCLQGSPWLHRMGLVHIYLKIALSLLKNPVTWQVKSYHEKWNNFITVKSSSIPCVWHSLDLAISWALFWPLNTKFFYILETIKSMEIIRSATCNGMPLSFS